MESLKYNIRALLDHIVTAGPLKGGAIEGEIHGTVSLKTQLALSEAEGNHALRLKTSEREVVLLKSEVSVLISQVSQLTGELERVTREALHATPLQTLPPPPQAPPQWDVLELKAQVEFLSSTLDSLETSLSGYEKELGAARREAGECLALAGTAVTSQSHAKDLAAQVTALTKELEGARAENATLQALALVGGGRETALHSALAQAKDLLGKERSTLAEVSTTLLSLRASNEAQERSLALLRGGGAMS